MYKSDLEVCLRAWEGRASGYEKVKEYEKAQSDARAMINAFPNLHKGYLRLGKLFRLQKRPEDALRIYSVGWKKTGHAEFERQIEIMKQSWPSVPRSVGFFELPAEIIMMVFRFLTAQDIEHVCRCNKSGMRFRWNNCRLKDYVRFTTQNHVIMPARRLFQDHQISRVYCSSKIVLKKLTKMIPSKELRTLELHSLDLSIDESSWLTMFSRIYGLKLINCIVSSSQIDYVLENYEGLKQLIVKNCHLIGKVQISGASIERFRGLQELQLSFTNFPLEPIYYKPKETNDPGCFLPYDINDYHSFAQWENSYIGQWMAKDGSGITKAANMAMTYDHGNHLRHCIINDPSHFNMIGSNLNSLHLFFPMSKADIQSLVLLLPSFGYLREIGIHKLHHAYGPIEPRGFIGSLMTGSEKKIICLPFLEALPFEIKRKIVLFYPHCRVIFDSFVSKRIVDRHWKIPKSSRGCDS